MIFTAMVREILLNTVQKAEARLEGIWISPTSTNQIKLYLNSSWTPSFDIGGGNLIITLGTGVYAGLAESGGLILSGTGLPYETVKDGSGNPVVVGTGYKYYVATFVDESTTLTEYHEYTSFYSVITDKKFLLNGSDGTDGSTVGTPAFDPGSVDTTAYFIHLAVPLLQVPGDESKFIVIKQFEEVQPGISSDCIDLRPYIKNMTWTTSIDKGFDTASIELNESASNLGKFYSYFLGQNVDIIDIYGNVAWNGIITSIYVDGNGGRIDAVGYKQTMNWFRFDKIYAMPEAGWDSSHWGPTSSQVLHDVTLMNPYMRKIFLGSDSPQESRNWALKGFVTDLDGNQVGFGGWDSYQLLATAYAGLNELDFSDGSMKCIDAIQTVESFGYAYTGEAPDEGYVKGADTVFMQCWHNGFSRICRVKKDPRALKSDYIITKRNVRNNNRGVELSGDINNIVTETYVIYNDSEGGRNVSGSTYNIRLAERYGLRVKVESSDYGPTLANLISQAARADDSLTIGIGSVTITGNVKGGGGAMDNLPVYMMRAGRIVEFEDNIGHGSLYKTADGTPGIFYIGSTSFDTESGQLTLSPAVTLSAIDLFIKQQSSLTN